MMENSRPSTDGSRGLGPTTQRVDIAKTMKALSLVLLVLLIAVHAELWFGNTGVRHVMHLEAQLRDQQHKNREAEQRNAQLTAEVTDLRDGLETVEEKARYELGMIRPNEILVRLPAAPLKASAPAY